MRIFDRAPAIGAKTLTMSVACCALLIQRAVCQTLHAPPVRGIEAVDSLVSAEFAKDSIGCITVGVIAGSQLAWTCSVGFADMKTLHPPLKHFVFFGRDRARIADSAFLANPNIAGAQIKYTWRELEPRRNRYDFAAIAEDLSALARHHKRLWIQLQDVSFGAENRVVPDYLLDDPAFSGGVADQYEGKAPSTRFVGRMARRWDPAVRARFARLLDTLGRTFDGKIEGLNLAETSFSIGDDPASHPAGFTYDAYAQGIRALMSAAHAALPRSRVIVYANFMPGEWLPDDDHGYLRGIYAYADSIGVGVGGPDLLPFRRGQRNHSLRFIAARGANTIAGLAVQDGNLAERNPATGERASVEALVRYATDTLRLDYIFWGTEEPYFSKEVLPWLAGIARPPDVVPRRAACCE